MLDNPNGSSDQELVDQMRSNRLADNPDLDKATGGADEVEAEAETSVDEDYSEDFEDSESEVYEEPEEDEQEVEARTWTIKADGQERQLTEAQMQEHASKGIDYTKKTMELAEQRKAIEAKDASISAKLSELASFIEQKDESIDWDNLRDTDPSEYLRQKELQESRKAILERESGELDAKRQEQRQSAIGEQTQALYDIMGKGWKGDVAAKDFDLANKYLISMGIAEDDVNQVIDHKLWKIFFDAAKYNRLRENKGKVNKEVRSAPKSVKPGSKRSASSQSEVAQALASVQSAGKMDQDAALVALMRAKRKGK